MCKFYAVKVGRKEGIFTSWDECRSYVDGYSGAVFKSFTTKSEAQEYMNAPLTENQLAHVPKTSPKKPVHVYKDGEKQTGMSLTLNREVEIYDTWPVAYVDGSFNAKTGVYGYGGFLLHRDKDGNIQKELIQGHNNKPEMAAMRNVAGEILGCEAAVKKAIALGLKCVIIYYDYAGIELWATGKWKRNKQETKDYYEFMRNAKALTHIVFCKVKGHSGNWGNEEADRLAKQAVGIK